jgi:hypothetical protein
MRFGLKTDCFAIAEFAIAADRRRSCNRRYTRGRSAPASRAGSSLSISSSFLILLVS